MKCANCQAKIPENRMKCPNCGKWSFAGESSAELFKLSELTSSDHDRLITGPWDLAWGGGIVKDSVTFFAGAPGSGKSTCLLQIASNVAAQGEVVLYVSKEETLGQVKARAERLEIPLELQECIILVPRFSGSIYDLAQEVRPKLLIVDSLPALVGSEWSDPRVALEVLESVKQFANSTWCPAIVVDHINKKGEFSGPVSFEHLIDTTMMLRVDKKNPGHRVLAPVKNRHGAVDVAVHLQMTAKGLVYVEPPDEETEESEGSD